MGWPGKRPDLSPRGRSGLNLVPERKLRWHAHAAPVMEMLCAHIVDSASMAVHCDAAGTLLAEPAHHALAKMSARRIENHWLSDACRNATQLHFHSRVECIGALRIWGSGAVVRAEPPRAGATRPTGRPLKTGTALPQPAGATRAIRS